MIEAYFMLSGRMRRKGFLGYSLLLWPILVAFLLLLPQVPRNARYPITVTTIFIWLFAAFWMWAGAALAVKRLHDLNKSGLHYLWMFLLPALLFGGGLSLGYAYSPATGAWSSSFGWSLGGVPLLAMLYLLFAPGSDGPNRFGYPP